MNLESRSMVFKMGRIDFWDQKRVNVQILDEFVMQIRWKVSKIFRDPNDE